MSVLKKKFIRYISCARERARSSSILNVSFSVCFLTDTTKPPGVIKSAFCPPDDRYRNRVTDNHFLIGPSETSAVKPFLRATGPKPP